MSKAYTISNAHLHVDPSESGLVGGWNMRPQGGQIIDLSPKGNDGTIHGARYEKTPLGDALVFDGVDDYVDIGNTGQTVKAVSFWLKASSTTEDIIDLDGGTHTIEVNAGTITATGFDTPTIYTNAVVSSALSANLWHFIAITTATGFVARDLDIGRETTYLDAKMVGFRTHSDEKALPWVTREYQKGRTALFKTDWGVTESIAAVASGPLEGSPFIVNSGTFKISMDTINGETVKAIECVTGGICYVPTSYFQQTPTEAAFGTWEFWINKAAASSLKIYFIDATTGAGTGYYFDFAADESMEIYEVGVGSKFKTAVSYAAASTWHKLNIFRTPAGVCSAYLNNTLIVKSTGDNPFTDITTTTSKYIVFDLDAGDLIAYADPKGKHNIVKKLLTTPHG